MYPALPSFIFACSVNLDAFFVSMSAGIRRSRISPLQNLLISLITFLGTVLSILGGTALTRIFPAFLANCLGSAILIAMGIYYIGKFYFLSAAPSFKPPKSAVLKQELSKPGCNRASFSQSLKYVLFLGAALSMNNVGIGVSAGIGGLSLFPASLITLITSCLFIRAGNFLGIHTLRFPEKYGDLLSGLVLILLGIIQGVL